MFIVNPVKSNVDFQIEDLKMWMFKKCFGSPTLKVSYPPTPTCYGRNLNASVLTQGTDGAPSTVSPRGLSSLCCPVLACSAIQSPSAVTLLWQTPGPSPVAVTDTLESVFT